MIVKHIKNISSATVDVGTGTSRQILINSDEAPNFVMRRFIMDPGGGMPNHTNTVEHEQFILQGEAKVGIGDKVIHVKKGNVLYIPAGVPHWYKAEGNKPFEILCIIPNMLDEIKVIKDKT